MPKWLFVTMMFGLSAVAFIYPGFALNALVETSGTDVGKERGSALVRVDAGMYMQYTPTTLH